MKRKGIILSVAAVGLILISSVIGLSLHSHWQADKQREECLAHLRVIEAATISWAMLNMKAQGDRVVLEEVGAFINGGVPHCPSGIDYVIPALGDQNPVCPLHGDLIKQYGHSEKLNYIAQHATPN